MNVEKIKDSYPDTMIIEGFDDCIVGVVNRFNMETIICYDRTKIINKLALDMSEEEAEEFFEFNILGAWVGETTPCFLETT